MTWRLSFQKLLHRGVKEGTTPFPGLLHFTLETYLIMLRVKQGDIKYHFLSLWYDSTGDWTSSLGMLVNILLIWPILWCNHRVTKNTISSQSLSSWETFFEIYLKSWYFFLFIRPGTKVLILNWLVATSNHPVDQLNTSQARSLV